ncbi:uncharacterized protein LOC126410973 isoform X2 [Schistocerca serialis cubense]|uniref:uncharacterized protein LOC126410973 isoform X2 n=1 Tax=Schistocerca serialis cubense TaxID=2023355 RepID=UPI00214E7330|nr:uncharacterized protein LOC126410973 isoform X2 [Schistocerca serialis cubense]
MGSCMSCKAGKEAYAYTTSPAAHRFQSYCTMDDVLPIAETKNGVTVSATKPGSKPETAYTRGQATLFGFKRRPLPAAASTPAAPPDNSAPLSNGSSQESLTAISPIQSGRSTPRLPRPKRDIDGNQTVSSGSASLRPNRFGFRGPSLTNKVADVNRDIPIVSPITTNSHTTSSNNNNNNNNNSNINNNNSGTVETDSQGSEKPRSKGGGRNPQSGIPRPKEAVSSIPVPDSNRQVKRSAIPQPNNATCATRFTLQTTLLPKPQYPVRLTSVDAEETESLAPSKNAKTAANKKRAGRMGSGSSGSREDGSDSGIGIGNGDSDTLHGIEQLERSPSAGLRRKARHLEVVLGNNKSFDVRDITDKDKDEEDDGQTVITEISVISLPKTNYHTASNKKAVTTSGIRRPIRYQGSGIPAYGNVGCRTADESSIATNSVSSPSSEEHRDDDSCSLDTEEAKVFDDRAQNEKSARDLLSVGGGPEEDLWGHGEAMAEGYSSSEGGDDCPVSISATDNTNSSDDLSVSRLAARHHNLHHARPAGYEPNKRVTIEDTLFAAIAASSSATLIEDERSPADSMISSGSASSEASEDVSECLDTHSLVQESDHVDSQEKDADGSQKIIERPSSVAVTSHPHSREVASPLSPGTPTNASNSLSLSEGRDFLIDDEIADQPGLTFGGSGTAGSAAVADLTSSSAGCSSLLLSVTENTTTLVDSSPRPAVRQHIASLSAEGSPGPKRGRRLSRAGSVDTLSPCESIASDDLMLDYEQSEGSMFDCTAESRLDGSLGGLQSTGDNVHGDSEADSCKLNSIGEWSSVLRASMKEAALVAGRPSRALRSRTGSTPTPTPDSPKSSVGAKASPLRPTRQSSASASGSDCEDGGLWLDRHTYHSICQDIVNHKTMLLKLLRHLQKAETLNPFDTQLKNGLFYNLASTDVPVGETDETNRSPQEELADLRRQVVFLQQQLEDKERTIQLLQVQMTKYTDKARENNVHTDQAETINAATQTERLRPVSAGPSLLQSLPSDSANGPLVSSSEVWLRRASTATRLPAPSPTVARLPKRGTAATVQSNSAQLPVHSHTPSSGIPTRRPQQLPVVTTKTS